MNFQSGDVQFDQGSNELDLSVLSERQLARIRRDRARGYSINTKQIVLAFAVEFTIIALILTNIYVTVAQLPDPSVFKTVQALLFPIAMAMVELARVPLAIAVRTQTSWLVKFSALLGVLCAVAVTSNSLYAIGASSFTPRLEETHKTNDTVRKIQDQVEAKEAEVGIAVQTLDQRRKDRDAHAQAIQSLNKQLTEKDPQNCSTVTVPGPNAGDPPSTRQRCTENPALKIIKAEISATKLKLDLAESTVVAAERELRLRRDEMRPLTKEANQASAESRESIFQSQLHSLAAMLFRVDPSRVTPEQLKTLEFYLVFISSIAAALSSTLIAMTAVQRIRAPKTMSTVTIPDEAAAYLFGPLIAAIRKEAADAVESASRGARESNAESRSI